MSTVSGTSSASGIARVRRDAEDHHAQPHADLRRGEAGAVQVRHRVAHVLQQRVQLRRAEALDRQRLLPAGADRPCAAPRGSCLGSQSFSRMRRTRTIASSEHRLDLVERDGALRCRRGRRRGWRPRRSRRIPGRSRARAPPRACRSCRRCRRRRAPGGDLGRGFEPRALGRGVDAAVDDASRRMPPRPSGCRWRRAPSTAR